MKLVMLMLVAYLASAQNLLEVRVAQNKYRYADWARTFKNNLVTDVFYIGVPGANELNFGLGRQFKLGKVTLVPAVYGVVAKETPKAGIKVGLLASFESDKWKGSFFAAHNKPLGDYPSYRFLDTLDMTRRLGSKKRWELGGSLGAFHSGSSWNPQLGPIVKLNDKDEKGQWGFSLRFITGVEARIARLWFF
ncbi:MAG: hypothetical protein Q8R08_03295 [bacterium]|nr:hypothetical protein [bacterium]